MQTKMIPDHEARIAGKPHPTETALVTSILCLILVIEILHLYFISGEINQILWPVLPEIQLWRITPSWPFQRFDTNSLIGGRVKPRGLGKAGGVPKGSRARGGGGM